MKFTYLCAAFACIFSLAVQPLSAGKKKKVQNQEQKVALGVWDDVDKSATVESLILWMKPFDEAGIKNYYMCGSPEEVARYIEIRKIGRGCQVLSGCKSACVDVHCECSRGFCGVGASRMV